MRIVDFSLASSFSPKAGAECRTFNLNFQLSKKFDVFQFSFLPSEFLYIKKTKLLKSFFHKVTRERSNTIQISLGSRIQKISGKYSEFTFANSFILFREYISWRLSLRPKLPIFFPHSLDQASFSLARRKMIQSSIVQVETPWPFDWVFKNTPKDKPIVLNEHQVEFLAYQKHIPDKNLRMLRKKEKCAVEKSDQIFVVSEDEKTTLCKEYSIDEEKIQVVPNGVDTSVFKPSTEKVKKNLKSRFGFSNKIIILFVGSACPPNFEAVKAIDDVASKVKNYNVLFLIVGSVGEYVHKTKSHNVFYTGYVNDVQPYLGMADIAINPRFSYPGGVSNIKILEYLASGLPVISAGYAAQVLSLENDKHILISNMDEFPEKIEELILDEEKRRRLSEEGRKIAEKYYDWEIIAQKIMPTYKNLSEA